MSVPVLLLPELLSVSVLLPESVSLQQPVLKNHIKVSIIVMPSTSIICFAFIIYHPLRSEDRSISFFIFYSSFYYPMYALKSQISVHKSIFREVFCHIYDKIPRHTGQNAITVGDLKCILAKCCERNEQQLNQAAITIFYSSLVRI